MELVNRHSHGPNHHRLPPNPRSIRDVWHRQFTMGKLEQLARDFTSLDQRLLQFVGTFGISEFPVDVHRQLLDEAVSRVEVLESVAVGSSILARRNIRAISMFRGLLGRFSHRADSIDAARDMRSCIEAEVLPLIDAIILEKRKEGIAATTSNEVPGPMTNAQISNWRIGNCIGKGGHARVYRVENVITGAPMCMKTIPFASDSNERAEQRERFEREVRVPAEIGHPFLAPVFDAGESLAEETYYFVMPLIIGTALDDWAKNKSVHEIIRKFISLLLPIGECHVRGLVHRDLKPSNILIDALSQQPWILDFGLSSVAGRTPFTRTGQFLGTVNYVSPEQAQDARTVVPQSDIWSLGVILFELLARIQVFPQAGHAQVLTAVTSGVFPDPEKYIPKPLAIIIRRCMAPLPDARYQNVSELSEALGTALGDQAASKPEFVSSFAPLRFSHVRDSDASYVNICEYCLAPDQHGARCSNCGRQLGMD